MSEDSHVPPISGMSDTLVEDAPATIGTSSTVAGPGPTGPHAPRGFHPGLELGGRYRLTKPLGKGGMGEVWEAEHTLLRRTVAIKLVLPDAGDRELTERLRREAEIVARLEHPNIVAVSDFGLLDDHQPYVVMERLVGRTLTTLLQERGPLAWTQAREIALQVVAGLSTAHAAGVLHRDLKPSNIFVLDDPHGRLPIKIIDFGLAKSTQLAPGERALTKSGAVFGTPAYMSPEQVRGEPLDARADLYALGAVLFEMIVGEPMWRRATIVQLLYCQLFEPAPTIRSRVPSVPIELDVLVARCLCKDRALRPAATDAMRLELVGVGSGKGATVVPQDNVPMPAPEIRARYSSAAEHAIPMPAGAVNPTPRRGRWWLVPVMVAGALAGATVVALGVVPRLRARAETPAPPVVETRAEVESPGAALGDPRPSDPASPAIVDATPEEADREALQPEPQVPVGTPPPAEISAEVSPGDPSDSDGRASPTAAKPRPNPRKAKSGPKAEPRAEPTPEPDAKPDPEPAPVIPKRKGDHFAWPTK